MQNDNLIITEIIHKASEKELRKLFSLAITDILVHNNKEALEWLISPECDISFLLCKIFKKQIRKANITPITEKVYSQIHLYFAPIDSYEPIGVLNTSITKQVLELSIKSVSKYCQGKIRVLTFVDVDQMLNYSVISLLNKFLKHLRDTNPKMRTILPPPLIETGNHPKIYTYIDNKKLDETNPPRNSTG